MKKILIALFLLSSFLVQAQSDTSTWLSNNDKGWRYNKFKVRKVFLLPGDTIYNKFGLAQIGLSLFTGNGTNWSNITAASTIDWSSITSKPTNFNTVYSTSNDLRDSIQARVRYIDTAGLFANRLKISDTLYMLLNRLKVSDTGFVLEKTIRTFGNQTGITGNKAFTNNIIANSFATSSGTSSQLLQADGSVQDKTDIHNGAFSFDTTGRLLTIPTLGGGSYSVLIPRGTASGAEGITALTSSRTGNIVSVFGDNGSTTLFSIRDADSSLFVKTTDTAAIVNPYTRVLRFLDSLTAIQGRIQTKQPLGAYTTLSDSTTILAGRWLPNRSADSISAIRALANTKGVGSLTSITASSPLTGGTITSSGSIGITQAGASADGYLSSTDWNIFNNKVSYTDALARASLSAGTGISYNSGTGVITNSAPDQTVVLTAGANIGISGTYPSFTITNTSTTVGTVTSVALSAPTGFTVSGSPITSSGTLGITFTAGYSLPTTASQALWDIAYTKRLSSVALSSSQLTLTLADASTVITSVPTFNQNTTGTASSLSAVLSSSLGGAGSVSGILKANGSGVVSAATAADIPSLSAYYLPLSGGTMTGHINMGAWNISNATTVTSVNGEFSAGVSTNSYKTTTGYTSISLNSITADITLNYALNGTSAAFSGVGRFGGAADIDASLAVQISTSGTGTAKWFGANKNGGYGLLVGYNEATGSLSGVGSYIRNVSADPMYFYVNNSTLAITIANTGVATFNANVIGTSARFGGTVTSGVTTSANTNLGSNYLDFQNNGSYVTGTIYSSGFNFNNGGGTVASVSSAGVLNALGLIVKNGGVPAIQIYRDLDVTSFGTVGQGIELGARTGSSTYVAGAAIYGNLDNPATSGSMNLQTLSSGTLATRLTLNSSVATFTVPLSGTSLSMSGAGYFGAGVGIANGAFLELAGTFTRIVRSGGIDFETNTHHWAFLDNGNTTLPNGGNLSVGGNVTASNYTLGGRGTSFIYGMPDWRIYNTSGNGLVFNNYTVDALAFSSTGAATFSSSVTTSGAVNSAGVNVSSGSSITIAAGDIQFQSNSGYGILSANSSRAIAITNTSISLSYATTVNDNLTVTKSNATLLDVRATAAGGNVEIKLNPTSNNSYSLYTAGSTDALEFKRGATTLMTMSSAGALTATGFIVSSDSRYKNIISQDGDLYTFTLKADQSNKIHYGYIAQEVEKSMPELITTDDKGYKAVNYTEVLAYKVRQLEKQIEELKKQNK